MTRLSVIVVAFALVAAACSGGGAAASCESVADEAIGLVQGIIDEFDNMSLEDLAALENEPPQFAELEQKANELEAKAEELGCSDAEMEKLMNERAGDLKAEGPFGQLLVESIKSEGGFFGSGG